MHPRAGHNTAESHACTLIWQCPFAHGPLYHAGPSSITELSRRMNRTSQRLSQERRAGSKSRRPCTCLYSFSPSSISVCASASTGVASERSPRRCCLLHTTARVRSSHLLLRALGCRCHAERSDLAASTIEHRHAGPQPQRGNFWERAEPAGACRRGASGVGPLDSVSATSYRWVVHA